jgi:hypothetical protein
MERQLYFDFWRDLAPVEKKCLRIFEPRAHELLLEDMPVKFHASPRKMPIICPNMNLLKNSNVYTIGHIQNECFKYATEWRKFLKEKLSPLGIKVLSPMDTVFRNFPAEDKDFQQHIKAELKAGNYSKVHQEMKVMRNKDLAMCDISTFLIAVINPDKPTWGSIDEIITSKRASKPVFLVIPELGYAGIPLWLASYFKPEWVYKDLESVVETIINIDGGKQEINNKYWRILND